VTYDTRTGQLAVWRAGSYLGSWTDPTPLTSGSYISLRTDTADVSFDSLIVLSVVKYYYSGGQRIALRRDGSVFYLLTDQLGSTRVTTDEATGAPAAEMKYYPFGWTRYNSGGDTPPLLQKTTYRFTGQRYGPGGGGLYDYGARWYDSYLNRWIQPDTIIPDPGNPQDLNRYAYCRNNPLKYIDPTGHQSLPPGVPNPYDWTAQRLLGAPDSRQLPQATGLQSLTTDIGKAVVEAIDKVNQVLAPAVEFLLGLFPGYDVVTAAVGTNVTGEKFSPGRRAVVGVFGLSPLDEVGDVASISVKFSNSTLRHEFAVSSQ